MEKHKEHAASYIEMYFKLSNLLPEQERREVWKKYILTDNNKYVTDYYFIRNLVNNALLFPDQWDGLFSVKVIKFLQKGLTDPYRSYMVSENILNLAPLIHPSALTAVEEIDNPNEQIKNSWDKIHEKLKHKVELLEEIKKAFAQNL